MTEAGLWIPRRQRPTKVYQPRARRECPGELIQTNGSDHQWFEERAPACMLLAYVEPQHRVAGMRTRVPAYLMRAPVESPCIDGPVDEAVTLGQRADVALAHPRWQKRSPEPASAAKIRQAGIHAHACTRRDHDAVRVGDPVRRAADTVVFFHGLCHVQKLSAQRSQNPGSSWWAFLRA